MGSFDDRGSVELEFAMRYSDAVRLGLLLLTMWLIVANSCRAQHMNAPDAPCQRAGSNADETACFVTTYQAADKELNRVYGVVLSIVDGDELLKLKAAQRLWIQFRDANCSAERELYRGGSAAPMVDYACLEAMTRNRTTELKTMYGWRVEKWDKKF